MGRFKRSLSPRRAVCLIFPLSFERARGGVDGRSVGDGAREGRDAGLPVRWIDRTRETRGEG